MKAISFVANKLYFVFIFKVTECLTYKISFMKNRSKKLFLINLLLMFAIYSHAQFLIGGSVYLNESNNVSSNGESQQNYWSFAPELGISYKQNHLIGLRYTYSQSKNEYSGETNERSTNQYSLFSRHRKPLGDFLNLFGEFGLSYSNSQSQNISANAILPNHSTTNTYSIFLVPGMEFKVTPKWLLSVKWGSISYAHHKFTNGSFVSKTNSITTRLNLNSLAIGFNYLFDVKKSED